jgi:hypothetical protein
VPVYLVERYWPGVTSEILLDALNRGRQMEQVSTEGTPVHHVTSILIPGEEVVFSLYEGQSTLAVRQLNERAAIPVSRIVAAIPMTGLDPLTGKACVLVSRYFLARIGWARSCFLPLTRRRPFRALK